MTSPAENPKTAVGQLKIDLSTIPPISLLCLGAAHDSGALKYGAFNWLQTPVPVRTYVAAAQPHIALYASGIEIDYAVDDAGQVLNFRVDDDGKFVLDNAGELIEDPAGKPNGSGLPHLALAMANMSILISAGAAGMLYDDRRISLELDGVMRNLAALKKGWPKKAA